MIHRLFILWLLAACLCFPGESQSQPTRADAAPRKPRHALLVGVTFYENLPKSRHLAGPGNDVLLVRKLLIEKLHFHPDQIVILSEQEGKDCGKNFLPTRANIEREFKRLAL